MIPVKRITIERAEGPSNLCVEVAFTSWNEASHWMYGQSHTFPKTGGYDKHDLTVEWQDGTTIGCRLDAKHIDCEHNELDVAERIWQCVSFYSGIRKPSRMTDEQYKAYVALKKPEGWVELCKKVAETCDISFYNGPKVS
jgi:hypothetical protein